MALADGTRREVERLLRLVGAPVLYIETTPGVYNPATGKVGGASITQRTLSGAFMSYTVRQVLADPILAASRRLLLEARAGFTPKTGSQAMKSNNADTRKWNIQDVQSYELNGQVVLYSCRCGRGPA